MRFGGVLSASFLLLQFVLQLACGSTTKAPTGVDPTGPMEVNGLKTARAFLGIADERERSLAMYNEAARVLTHPRCVNCHPGDSRPRQGQAHVLHVPPIHGGDDGRGMVGLRCTSCHQTKNFGPASVPGAPNWHLAPNSMGWLGRDATAVCQAIKDEDKNGGRDLSQIVDHVGHDPLVAWGFAPGGDREPAPGDQKSLSSLMRAWVDTGAVCP